MKKQVKKEFIINQANSLVEFFDKYVISENYRGVKKPFDLIHQSYLLNKSFPKSYTDIKIILNDKSTHTNTKLLNTYYFKVKSNDSMSMIAELVTFNVSIVK